MSRVSVIVPTYGQREALRLALWSLANHVTVTVLDFDSFDGTAQFVDGMALLAPDRIRYVSCSVQNTTGEAIASQVANISADVVVLLHPETIVSLASIDRIVSAFQSLESVGMALASSNVGPLPCRSKPPFNDVDFERRLPSLIAIPPHEIAEALTPIWAHEERVAATNKGRIEAVQLAGGGVLALQTSVFQTIPWPHVPDVMGWPDTVALSNHFNANNQKVVVVHEAFAYNVGSRLA